MFSNDAILLVAYANTQRVLISMKLVWYIRVPLTILMVEIEP